jgi:tol-pal system protein YbgF
VGTSSARLVVGLLAGALAALAGCGGPMANARPPRSAADATDVDHLRAELRAERRQRQDLENQVLVLKDQLETARLRTAAAAVPTLPVEVLSPDDVPEHGRLVGVADDGSEIVYAGDAMKPPIEIDPAELGGGPDGGFDRDRPRARPRRAPAPPPDFDDLPSADELEAGVKVRDLPTTPPRRAPTPGLTRIVQPASAGATTAAAIDDAAAADPAAALYRRGTAALKSREYEAAIAALREVVTRFPRHDLADNAQYWLGEAYYDQKDYPRALAEFRATVAGYPRGNKVADALLKVGYAYAALGDGGKAKAALEQVVALYPGTPPAALAASRLETLP